MTWGYYSLDQQSRLVQFLADTQDQLLEDLLTLNALLSITHIVGTGWDASRNRSIEATKQERLLVLQELN